MVWLHSLNDLQSWVRDADQVSPGGFVESLAAFVSDGEGGLLGCSTGEHFTDGVVQRRSQVVDEVTEDERDLGWRFFRAMRREEVMRHSLNLVILYADEVRSALPESLKDLYQLDEMVVRPLDLSTDWTRRDLVRHA
jgi:hypothetical protein